MHQKYKFMFLFILIYNLCIGMQAQIRTIDGFTSIRYTSPWYVKSNLAYDVILMPSFEIEYRFCKRWSMAVEGNIAWWHNDNKLLLSDKIDCI